MKHKVKIDDDIFNLVGNELRRNLKGFRGISSKKKRKREKNFKKVIPIILKAYLENRLAFIWNVNYISPVIGTSATKTA